MEHGSSQHGEADGRRKTPAAASSGRDVRWSCVASIEPEDASASVAREDTARRLLASLIARRLSGSPPHATGRRGGGDAAEGDAVTLTAASPSVVAPYVAGKRQPSGQGGASD